MIKKMMRTSLSKTIALVVLLQLCAVANSSLFTLHSSLLHAQGLPLIRNYSAAEYGGHNRNYDIEIGADGTVFVANFEGLLYFDRARWRMIHTPDISRITVVYRDSRNTVWVGGYNYFARLRNRPNGELYLQQVNKKGQFQGEVMEIFEESDGENPSSVSLQFVATDNNIYEVKGGAGNAVPTISLKKHTKANFKIGVESDIISVEALKEGDGNALLEDITQTEVIGYGLNEKGQRTNTDGRGLNEKGQRTNTDESGLLVSPSKSVKSDAKKESDAKEIGGLQVKVKKNSGLIIADCNGRDLYTITEANGLCSNQVAYVAYDGHGMLWGATSHGIFSIELPSVYSYFLPKDGFTGETHAIMAFDGKMYVGSTNGLFVIDVPLPTRSFIPDALASPRHLSHSLIRQCRRIEDINNICWALCRSREGLLAATSSGIYRVAPGGKVSRLTTNSTTSLLVDGDKVYAGEPDGVSVYTLGNGQSSKLNDFPLVTEIRQDAQGNLWFQNVRGETSTIGDYKSTEDDAERDVVNGKAMNRRLLIPLSSIDVKAQFRYGNQIWIGGDEILAVIDTGNNDLASLTDCRTVRFRSIVMGSDSVLWGGYSEMPKRLQQLDCDEGNLHFYYALDYVPLSGKTLYRYRLNSNKWSAWTDKQDVEFLNLPYGSFTLSVQAQLANGELSEVATIGFSIAYPLLMRWYMVVLYLLVFAYIVYLLFRYRLKRLQKDKVKLERIVEERTADLRNAQQELIRQEKMATVGKLTEGLIDRILNPMNYIINFSKMSNDLLNDLKENIDNNKDNINEDDYEDTLDVLDMLTQNLKSVDQYGQNTTRTLKAMEEMLKDRTGGYVEMDLLPVLQQNEEMLNTYFAKEKEQCHIQTTFHLPHEAMPLHGNPEMLSKTMMSLLGNAVYAVVRKYQKEPYSPEVSLTATFAGGQYILKVHDNGIGIEEKTIGKIFDPFFTTKTTDEAAGVGLYLSREIIQNHGGDISVASVKDEFTEFTITLPRVKN